MGRTVAELRALREQLTRRRGKRLMRSRMILMEKASIHW
jgi:hypothetical protein